MSQCYRMVVRNDGTTYLFVLLFHMHFNNRCVQFTGTELRIEIKCREVYDVNSAETQLNLRYYVETRRDLDKEKEQILESSRKQNGAVQRTDSTMIGEIDEDIIIRTTENKRIRRLLRRMKNHSCSKD